MTSPADSRACPSSRSSNAAIRTTSKPGPKSVLARFSENTSTVGQRTVHSSCTIGLTAVPTSGSSIDAVVADVLEAVRRARAQGGNQIFHLDKADTDTRVQAYDMIWVKHIKSALMENRFRLVQQPVASLQGEDPNMFDVLVRMLDHQGKEVLPAEFMAAAERNDLLKNIDRWVVGASLSFAAKAKPGCLFVRLSRDSVVDTAFIDWLKTQLANGKHEPKRICFQITESIAEQYMNAAVAQLGALKKLGFRIALERFGSGRDPYKLLSAVPLDFIKIDGALVQDLAGESRDADRRSRSWSSRRSSSRSRPSPNASRTPTPWPCCGSSACSSSRATSSTHPKKWSCPRARAGAEEVHAARTAACSPHAAVRRDHGRDKRPRRCPRARDRAQRHLRHVFGRRAAARYVPARKAQRLRRGIRRRQRLPGGSRAMAPRPIKETQIELWGPPLIAAGYTVFAINHRGAPRFHYPAAVEDMQRAIRFVRSHATDYGIDAARLGGLGGSSGGNLIGLAALRAAPGLAGDPDAVNRAPATLQAVVLRAAVTDLRSMPTAAGANFVVSYMETPPGNHRRREGAVRGRVARDAGWPEVATHAADPRRRRCTRALSSSRPPCKPRCATPVQRPSW